MEFCRTPIDRRSPRAQQLVAMIMAILKGRIADGEYGSILIELNDLMWCQGAQVVTDADRQQAGLPPRNHHGMTLEELAVLERRQIEAMLQPHEVMFTDMAGIPEVKTRREPQYYEYRSPKELLDAAEALFKVVANSNEPGAIFPPSDQMRSAMNAYVKAKTAYFGPEEKTDGN